MGLVRVFFERLGLRVLAFLAAWLRGLGLLLAGVVWPFGFFRLGLLVSWLLASCVFAFGLLCISALCPLDLYCFLASWLLG